MFPEPIKSQLTKDANDTKMMARVFFNMCPFWSTLDLKAALLRLKQKLSGHALTYSPLQCRSLLTPVQRQLSRKPEDDGILVQPCACPAPLPGPRL